MSLKRDRDEEEEFEEKAEVAKKAAKTTKKSTPPIGEAVFTIGPKRKVTVSLFKGNILVNIREFYEDKATGEEKPGNKGIALSLDQWNQLKTQMDQIDAAVQARRA